MKKVVDWISLLALAYGFSNLGWAILQEELHRPCETIQVSYLVHHNLPLGLHTEETWRWMDEGRK